MNPANVTLDGGRAVPEDWCDVAPTMSIAAARTHYHCGRGVIWRLEALTGVLCRRLVYKPSKRMADPPRPSYFETDLNYSRELYRIAIGG